MTATDDNNEPVKDPTLQGQHKLYHGVMDFSLTVGIPAVGAFTMFVTLLLMQTHIIVSIILAGLTWLGILGIAKAFFVHD